MTNTIQRRQKDKLKLRQTRDQTDRKAKVPIDNIQPTRLKLRQTADTQTKRPDGRQLNENTDEKLKLRPTRPDGQEMPKQTHERMYSQTDRQTDGGTDRQTDRQTSWYTSRQTLDRQTKPDKHTDIVRNLHKQILIEMRHSEEIQPHLQTSKGTTVERRVVALHVPRGVRQG